MVGLKHRQLKTDRTLQGCIYAVGSNCNVSMTTTLQRHNMQSAFTTSCVAVASPPCLSGGRIPQFPLTLRVIKSCHFSDAGETISSTPLAYFLPYRRSRGRILREIVWCLAEPAVVPTSCCISCATLGVFPRPKSCSGKAKLGLTPPVL
jgi:hypothetical protein